MVVTNTTPNPETAWAANGLGDAFIGTLPFPGSNWATYVAYFGVAKTVTFFASQDEDVGTVTFGAPAGGMVTITINLTGATFTGAPKVQDYALAPTVSNPAPGQFAHTCTLNSAILATCTVPTNNFYAVHGVVIEN